MIRDLKLGFVGGDIRQIYCAKKLAEMGFEVALYGFGKQQCDIGLCTKCTRITDVLDKAEVVVLPLPVSNDGITVNTPYSDSVISLSEVLHLSKDAKMLLYGGSNGKIEQLCREKDIIHIDYSKREDFRVLNAEPTAEGAIAIALNEMKSTIFGSNALVIGYGRIGKILSRYLKSIGATTYVAARRSEQLAEIKLSGCIPVHTLELDEALSVCKLIINTVPKTILKNELLETISKDALIIDLASKPGGIDFKSAGEKGLNVIWALSLPGRFSPISAGEILGDILMEIIKEYFEEGGVNP